MRIGMMLDLYKPHVSGVTHYVDLSKRFLERQGHEVYIFTFGDLDYADREPNVIRSSGVHLPERGIYLGFSYTRAARQLIRTMDLVHVHHPFLSGRLALRYCRPAGIPIVFTNHTRYDLYAQAYLPMLPDQIGSTFLQTYLPSLCREVDLVIAPSEGLKRVLRQFHVRSHIEVIPNGVDLEPFEDPSDPVSRQELAVPEEDVLLAYSGRLGPEKNLTFLLRAFSGAQQAYPNTSLVLMGDGPERDNLQHLADRMDLGEKVIFTGLIPYERIPSYLAAADGFVTASVTEVHPLSVIEALAAGLPVVGIDSPGVGDTVVDGHNGLLSRHDLAAYTAKLTRFLADKASRELYSQAAPLTAQKYDIRRTTAIIEGQYARLLSLPPRERPSLVTRLWKRLREGAA